MNEWMILKKCRIIKIILLLNIGSLTTVRFEINTVESHKEAQRESVRTESPSFRYTLFLDIILVLLDSNHHKSQPLSLLQLSLFLFHSPIRMTSLLERHHARLHHQLQYVEMLLSSSLGEDQIRLQNVLWQEEQRLKDEIDMNALLMDKTSTTSSTTTSSSSSTNKKKSSHKKSDKKKSSKKKHAEEEEVLAVTEDEEDSLSEEEENVTTTTPVRAVHEEEESDDSEEEEEEDPVQDKKTTSAVKSKDKDDDDDEDEEDEEEEVAARNKNSESSTTKASSSRSSSKTSSSSSSSRKWQPRGVVNASI